MIFLIIGRTGSGKDYLASKLVEKGLKQVKSYASRPKRYETEDTHIFISPDDVNNYTDKVATTNIKGYDYFATAQQVAESDIYIIDPNGFYELTQNMPDETFHLIYVYADDTDRRIHAVSRADNKIKEEQIFEERDTAENEQFSDFESKLRQLDENDNDDLFPNNVTVIRRFVNDYDKNNTDKYVEMLLSDKSVHDRVTNIVKESVDLNIISPCETDNNKVIVKTTINNDKFVTMEHFADVVIGNDKWLGSLMKEYIRKSNKFS